MALPKVVRESIADLRVDVAIPSRMRKSALPVLFIHGAFAGGWYWEKFLRYMASRGRPAYALTLRGRPDSRQVTDLGSISLRDYRADTELILRELSARHERPFALVGHSMGGFITQMLLERQKFGAGVLVTPVPPSPILLRPGTGFSLGFLDAGSMFGSLVFQHPVVPDEAIAHEVIRQFGEDPCSPPDSGYFFVPESARAILEMFLFRPWIDRSAVLQTPLLVLGASHDAMIAPETAGEVASHYGDAEQTVFPGRTHMLMVEPGWEEVAERIDQWLRVQECAK